MERAKTLQEWQDNETARRNAISTNRSRRLKGLPPIPQPDKLGKPIIPVAYGPDGSYEGTVAHLDPSEYDPTWTIRMEEVK